MIRNLLLWAALVAVPLSAVSAPALAHVTLEVQEARIGASYKAVLRVPHGCGAEATNLLHVRIPEGFFNVKPMPKPGWDLETVIGPYGQSYSDHGTELTEGVVEIIWSGGELPSDWYDEFVFRGSFAESLEVGEFHFPVIQECAGGEAAWIDTSGDPAASHPAPSLKLLEGPGHH